MKWLFSIVVLFVSFSLNSMQTKEVSLERKYKNAMPFVINEVATNHFTDKYDLNNKDEFFVGFINDIRALSCVNKIFDAALKGEDMHKQIVRAVAEKMKNCCHRNDYYCAQRLGDYAQCYQEIACSIAAAFNPEGEIRDVWYVNATQYIPGERVVNNYCWAYHGTIMTPLHLAIYKADCKWAEKLIAQGADIHKERVDDYDRYPLISLVIEEHISHRNWVMHYDKAVREKYGNSANHLLRSLTKDTAHACVRYQEYKKGYCSILGILLEHKARFDKPHVWIRRDGPHKTFPFDQAIKYKDEEAVLLLHQCGAVITDAGYLTAEDYAWFNRLGIGTIALAEDNTQ